jgi:hypothetical protein
MKIVPSRRTTIVITIAALAGAALGSAIAALATVSHYRSEHAAAVRDRSERRSLLESKARLQRIAEARQLVTHDLEGRVARTRTDLTYAIGRWRRAQTEVAALRAQTASLTADLATAESKAKDSYNSGYDKGYADTSDTFSASPPDTTSGACDPNYEGACVPTGYGDVDCGDLIETDFNVVGVDIDGLDGDGDGIACESY